MSLELPPYWLIRIAVATVWFYEGLWCKLLGGQPHELTVVESVPWFGPRIGALFLRALGVVEVALGAWVLSGIAPILCAIAQTVGWCSARLHEFLDMDDPSRQIAYWLRYLDTRRFRAAFDGMLSLTALRAVYASPFLDFLPPHLGKVMRQRMERCFGRHANRTNPYARALLLGELPAEPPPPEAGRIILAHADAAGYLERAPAASFDGIALSNILDGADPGYERRLMAAVKRAAAPDAVLVLRSFREPPTSSSTNFAADDRAMLWGIVDVRPAAML